EGDGRLRKDFPGGWPGDKINEFTREGRSAMQNEAWDYLQKLLQWRKKSAAVTQGTMIHYAPQNSVYVYGRIKDNSRVLVILNGSVTDQTVSMDRFTDITSGFNSGRNVITSQVFDLKKALTIPAKGEYI